VQTFEVKETMASFSVKMYLKQCCEVTCE